MDFRVAEAILLGWYTPVIVVGILKLGIFFIKNLYTKSNVKRQTIKKTI
tara:strand:+ start:1522 stop:1668 length:147 start_codon:yes stop_codon:yes gene_type:complete